MNHNSLEKTAKGKILLTMLPYWTPLIPPQGIGMLKSYLTKYGYAVKCTDLNVDEQINNIYSSYFNTMREYIPSNKQGNFFNIGHDVLHNHMMAAIKYTDEKAYIDLVKELVYYTYYTEINDEQVNALNEYMKKFYLILEDIFIKLIEEEKPDVVGFSLFKGNLPATIFVAKLIRQRYPHIKLVTGGGAFADSHAVGSPSFEALVKETEDCIDLIMVGGQGERLFLTYLEGGFKGKRIVTLKDAQLSPVPFEELDIADLSDFDISKYPYIAATASSSCPNKCSFCNASKYMGEFKRKNAKQVVDEMERIYKTYGNQLFFMTDSLLNPSIDELSEEFKRLEVPLYYDCYFRVDTESADLDNTFRWRRGGLYRTRMGIESGSQKILDLMDKKITVEQTKAALYGLASAGIKTTAYIVIGHPDETEEDFQMTLDLMEEMKDYIWQAEPNPFYYHYAGQFASDSWADKRMLLYSESARDMLVFDTWTLNCYPLREERYDRVHRFMMHCKKLGIPNPYSAKEIYDADERWKRLHQNAVPSVWQFTTGGPAVVEAKEVVRFKDAKVTVNLDDAFAF